jgi:hypothetical protein
MVWGWLLALPGKRPSLRSLMAYTGGTTVIGGVCRFLGGDGVVIPFAAGAAAALIGHLMWRQYLLVSPRAQGE